MEGKRHTRSQYRTIDYHWFWRARDITGHSIELPLKLPHYLSVSRSTERSSKTIFLTANLVNASGPIRLVLSALKAKTSLHNEMHGWVFSPLLPLQHVRVVGISSRVDVSVRRWWNRLRTKQGIEKENIRGTRDGGEKEGGIYCLCAECRKRLNRSTDDTPRDSVSSGR